MRTRPRFDEWSCEFELEVDETLVSVGMIEEALVHGARIGFAMPRRDRLWKI